MDRFTHYPFRPEPSKSEEPMTDLSANQDQSVRQAIESAIAENAVILFMKGTPDDPKCGFSARCVATLQALESPFAAVDILPDPRLRQELSAISNWPTIPQLFVRGELIGGCDIITELYESGELAEVLGVQTPPEAPAKVAPGLDTAAPIEITNRLS